MHKQNPKKLAEYNIFSYSLKSIDLVNNKVINTINPHSYCVAKRDLQFKEALLSSDILLPDGVGIVLAERFLSYWFKKNSKFKVWPIKHFEI